MKHNGTFGILLATIMLIGTLAGCGVRRPQATRNPEPVFDTLYRTDSLRAVWYYTEGLRERLTGGDTLRALALQRRAMALDPGYAPARFEAASLLAALDSLPQALAYSQEAVALDTTNLWYRNLLGWLLIGTHDYDRALKVYRRLVVEAPHSPVYHRMLAALYEAEGQPFSAIAVLDTALYKLGMIPELADYRRRLLIGARLYDQAIAQTRELIDAAPHEVGNYVVLGQLYAFTDRDSLALTSYRKALQIDSTDAAAIAALGEYYREQGDETAYLGEIRRLFQLDDVSLDRKAELFEQLTSNIDYYRRNYFIINDLATTIAIRYPNDFRALELYVGHLLTTGNLDHALVLLKQHTNDSLHAKEIYASILNVESYLQRADSVVFYARQAALRFPDDPEPLLSEGMAMLTLDRPDEALVSLRKAYALSTTDSARSVAMGAIGDILYDRGRERAAYRAYRKALRLDADNYSILNNFAYYLSEAGRELEKAVEMSRRATELMPANPTLLDTYGWALYKTGRYEEAKKIMQQALSFDTDNSAELLVHYGDILHALGDRFLAEIYWKRALEAGYDADEITRRMEGGKQ